MFLFSGFSLFQFLNCARLNNDPWGDIFGYLIYGPFFLMLGLIGVCTLVIMLIGKMDVLNARRDKYVQDVLSGVREKRPVVQDLLRKSGHMIFFVMLFSISMIAKGVFRADYGDLDFLFRFWEIRPDLYYFTIYTATDPAMYQEIGIMHTPLIFAFHIGAIISMFLDWVRMSTKFWTIGRNTLIKFARKSEINAMPSFIPFFTGILAMSILLPPLPIYAMMACVIFADTAASQIGIRFGKHKLAWNKKKSWEGAIAGMIMALFITYLFVGPIWAIVATICFFIGDGLTEHPLKISDNLLIPVIIGVSFVILFFSGIPYAQPSWLL